MNEDKDRTHQDDRFWRNDQHYSNNHRQDFQYCRFCNEMKPFEYDRCKSCGNK